MIDHVAKLNAIRDNLAAFLATLPTPASNRIVTRKWKPLQLHTADELANGVYTLISNAEDGYPDYNGGEAQDGFLKLVLIGRFQLPESAGTDEIEDGEWSMFDNEIAPWLRTLPLELCCLAATKFVTSGQVQHPYGVCAWELEEWAS